MTNVIPSIAPTMWPTSDDERVPMDLEGAKQGVYDGKE